MFDQLIIGERASVDDFDASVASRKIGQPTKKTIKETVPFSNKTYDFSAINGELYWNERELEYVFEIDANTPQELEEKKTAFSDWVMNVLSEKIVDPYIQDYHFVGTFADISPEDDESMLKSTIAVKFNAYPYKIANNPTTCQESIDAGASKSISVVNNSSHRMNPTITTDETLEIVFGNTTYTLSAGTYKSGSFMLAVGVNTFEVKNTGAENATITISFSEEVF